MSAIPKSIKTPRGHGRNAKRTDRSDMHLANPGILQYAEYEVRESARDNYSHARAVQIVEQLSNLYRKSWPVMSSIVVNRLALIDTLTSKKIPFVLTGMHGIVSWLGRPRATHDVDFLVKGGRNYARTVKAIRELYPELVPRRIGGVTAFFTPGETLSLIDVSFPHRVDIQATLETAIWVDDDGRRYRIPTLEAALANKYGASVALGRDPGKRGQDMVDFYNMVKHSTDPGRAPIDLDKLGALGESISPSIGRAEILRMVAEAKAGKVPHPNI